MVYHCIPFPPPYTFSISLFLNEKEKNPQDTPKKLKLQVSLKEKYLPFFTSSFVISTQIKK